MKGTIHYLKADSQAVHRVLDFPTQTLHTFIESGDHLVEAVESRKSFDKLRVLRWFVDAINARPGHETRKLACEFLPDKRLRIELTDELLELMPYTDPEAVWFALVGKEVDPDGGIKLDNIGFIHVCAFLQEGCSGEIRDDKFFIRVPRAGDLDGPEPEEKKAVVAAPEKRGEVRRLDVPPRDVVKEGKRLELWPCWLKIYRQLYRRSGFKKLRDVPHYPRETRRKGRYYFCGNEYLARITGLDRRTIERALHQLEAENLIYTRYHGFKGRGCSIIELPCNLKLVWKWRRQPGRQKIST